jgi:Ubiquitin-activating enzyme active site
LSVYPLDKVDDSGKEFWSAPKRAPKEIKLDFENTHLRFIKAAAALQAKIFKIDYDIEIDLNDENLKNWLPKLKGRTYRLSEEKKKSIKSDVESKDE